MTSLAIAEGWTMTGDGPRGGRNWSNWREVVTAWTVAVILAGALLLGAPRHDAGGPAASFWSISPAAGGHAHHHASDDEGPSGTEACSDRDYANELC
jgi:hypothetical protein